MTDLRDRMARAICIADGTDPDEEMPQHPAFKDVTTFRWQVNKPAADAAIALIVEECAKVAARQIADWSYIIPSARAWHAENVAAAIRALSKEGEV